MCMPSQPPVTFVSYSRSDSEFALRLAKELRAAGMSIWLDQLDISPGERWDQAVGDALINCSSILVILSPASVSSTNVLDEVSYALDEGKAVIPALYAHCIIPFRLRRLQYIDFRSDYSCGLRSLLNACQEQGLTVDFSIGKQGASLPPRELTVKTKIEDQIGTKGASRGGSRGHRWIAIGVIGLGVIACGFCFMWRVWLLPVDGYIFAPSVEIRVSAKMPTGNREWGAKESCHIVQRRIAILDAAREQEPRALSASAAVFLHAPYAKTVQFDFCQTEQIADCDGSETEVVAPAPVNGNQLYEIFNNHTGWSGVGQQMFEFRQGHASGEGVFCLKVVDILGFQHRVGILRARWPSNHPPEEDVHVDSMLCPN
jgi:TIR domain